MVQDAYKPVAAVKRVKRVLKPVRRLLSPVCLSNLRQPPAISRDQFGAVYPSLGVFYNRVPKAATNTVLSLLNELQDGVVEERSSMKEKIIRPSHLSWRDARKFYELFKFTFVRDPFERLLSAWLDKVVGDARYQAYSGFQDKRPRSFARFVTELEAGALRGNRYFLPQCSLLIIPLGQFDFVGRVERFADDFPIVLNAIGKSFRDRNLATPYPTDKRKVNKSRELLAEYYSPIEVVKVVNLYSLDFKELGYPKEPHWL